MSVEEFKSLDDKFFQAILEILKVSSIIILKLTIILIIICILYYILQYVLYLCNKKNQVCLKITVLDGRIKSDNVTNLLEWIHALTVTTKWYRKLFKGDQILSFEIVKEKDNEVAFYLVIHKKFINVIRHKIENTYNENIITEQKKDYLRSYDYSSLQHISKLKVAYNKIYPFKTGKSITNSITESLSQVKNNCIVQVKLKPIKNKQWQKYSKRQIKKIEKLKGRLERKQTSLSTSKAINPVFSVKISVVTLKKEKKLKTHDNLQAITSSFFNLEDINKFKRKRVYFKKIFWWSFENRYMHLNNTLLRKSINVLAVNELSNFFLNFNYITSDQLPLKRKYKEIVERKNNIIGTTVDELKIGLKNKDMCRHAALIGSTGSGKSELLKNIIYEAAETNNKTIIVFDPHGKLAKEVIKILPESRLKDVMYYDLGDSKYPVPLNLLKCDNNKVDEVTEEFLNILKSLFSSTWGPRSEEYLRHGIRAVIEAGEGNILNVRKILTDYTYRKKIMKKIKNPITRDFFDKNFRGKFDKQGNFILNSIADSAIRSPLTKLDRFLSNDAILNMIAQNDCIDFKNEINNNKIILFNFSKEILLDDALEFLGAIVFSKVKMSCMARGVYKKNHVLWVLDEGHNFITKSTIKAFKSIMDELRKYRIQFMFAFQRVEQVQEVASALFDNVGSIMAMGAGDKSADYMAKVLDIPVNMIKNLETRYMYAKIIINNIKTNVFMLKSLDKKDEVSYKEFKERLKLILDSTNRKTVKEVRKEVMALFEFEEKEEQKIFIEEMDEMKEEDSKEIEQGFNEVWGE